MINLKVKLVTKESESINNYKAIKIDEKIIYRDELCNVTILKNKIIRKNNDYEIVIDLIDEKCNYYLKEGNFAFDIKVVKLKKTINSLLVHYLIENNLVKYEIEVIK